MRIALGADHAGVNLKDHIKHRLLERGLACADFGTAATEPVDYPDYARRVAVEVASGAFDRGILICGSGIGMAIAANKVPGIRAASVADEESARLSRAHNDANVLSLGGRVTTPEVAGRLVDLFLDTPFAGGRHERRLAKITEMERHV